MTALKFVAVFGVTILFFSGEACAQTNVWSTGFPKKTPGGGAGSVDVAGTATAAGGGWTLQGTGAITYYPSGGGVTLTVPITVNKTTGAWSSTFVSEYGAAEITIIVQVTEKNGGSTRTISTSAQNITP